MPESPSTAEASPAAARQFRHTYWFLWVYYTIAAVWGLREIWPHVPSRIDLLFPLVFAVALGSWAVVDARRRRHPIPMLARPWFFFFALLAVPAYVVWSREWRGVGWVALNAVLFYALATAVMHGFGILFYGDEWLSNLDI